MDVDLYHEAFHLNDTKIDLIAGLIPPGQMVICQPQLTKKARLEVDSITHWMAVNSAGENLLRQEYFIRYGIAEGLRRLADEHPFEPRRQARALTFIPHGAAA